MNFKWIDPETPYIAVASPSVDARTVPTAYQKYIAEARNLYWNDDLFDDEDGVIAVFDFDYDKMVQFETQIRAATQFITLCVAAAYVGVFLGYIGAIAVLGVYVLSLAPCLLRQQVLWEAESNHLCITRDGIRYVNDRRKSCWGFGMCDKGKSSKTVPFDKITDCDIIEPAGNACLFFSRILYTVNVDTASSGGEGHRHELKIVGLKEPHRFKALVWAMKRSITNGTAATLAASSHEGPDAAVSAETFSAAAGQKETMDRAGYELTKNRSTSSGVLRDIRDELRQNNQLLRDMVHQQKQEQQEKN